jgi:hypothetical protein
VVFVMSAESDHVREWTVGCSLSLADSPPPFEVASSLLAVPGIDAPWCPAPSGVA